MERTSMCVACDYYGSVPASLAVDPACQSDDEADALCMVHRARMTEGCASSADGASRGSALGRTATSDPANFASALCLELPALKQSPKSSPAARERLRSRGTI